MTLHTRKNYICTCVSFINILTELPKPSTTTLAYMEDYDEKTHIKGKMRSCEMRKEGRAKTTNYSNKILTSGPFENSLANFFSFSLQLDHLLFCKVKEVDFKSVQKYRIAKVHQRVFTWSRNKSLFSIK